MKQPKSFCLYTDSWTTAGAKVTLVRSLPRSASTSSRSICADMARATGGRESSQACKKAPGTSPSTYNSLPVCIDKTIGTLKSLLLLTRSAAARPWNTFCPCKTTSRSISTRYSTCVLTSSCIIAISARSSSPLSERLFTSKRKRIFLNRRHTTCQST